MKVNISLAAFYFIKRKKRFLYHPQGKCVIIKTAHKNLKISDFVFIIQGRRRM